MIGWPTALDCRHALVESARFAALLPENKSHVWSRPTKCGHEEEYEDGLVGSGQWGLRAWGQTSVCETSSLWCFPQPISVALTQPLSLHHLPTSRRRHPRRTSVSILEWPLLVLNSRCLRQTVHASRCVPSRIKAAENDGRVCDGSSRYPTLLMISF